VSLFSADDFSKVNFRYVPRENQPGDDPNPFRRYRAARGWHRSVSEGYDLFVNCTHWLPCFCHAKAGALLVLFPIYVRPEDSADSRLPRWKRLRHAAYYETEWARRLRTYRHRVTISDFSRSWTLRRWRIDCDVIPPPVDVEFDESPKDPLILSVGRFSTGAHTKKQLELMAAFADLTATAVNDWTYASVGGLNSRPENHAYFERVKAAGQGRSTLVQANLDAGSLRRLFQRARIFWHATGYNDDTGSRPELAEHFGISTVEAMAAGCVPVVVNKGGQPEIVRHGHNGFVWNTIDELKHYTNLLVNDMALWTRMSAAARADAQQYSRFEFLRRFSSHVGVPLPVKPALELLTARS
jgi:glycosyltransferase involved in cell wall biosynthesis